MLIYENRNKLNREIKDEITENTGIKQDLDAIIIGGSNTKQRVKKKKPTEKCLDRWPLRLSLFLEFRYSKK